MCDVYFVLVERFYSRLLYVCYILGIIWSLFLCSLPIWYLLLFSVSQLYYDLQNNQACYLHKADKYNPCKFSLYLWEVVLIFPFSLKKKKMFIFAGGVNNVFIKYDWFISLFNMPFPFCLSTLLLSCRCSDWTISCVVWQVNFPVTWRSSVLCSAAQSSRDSTCLISWVKQIFNLNVTSSAWLKM